MHKLVSVIVTGAALSIAPTTFAVECDPLTTINTCPGAKSISSKDSVTSTNTSTSSSSGNLNSIKVPPGPVGWVFYRFDTKTFPDSVCNSSDPAGFMDSCNESTLAIPQTYSVWTTNFPVGYSACSWKNDRHLESEMLFEGSPEAVREAAAKPTFSCPLPPITANYQVQAFQELEMHYFLEPPATDTGRVSDIFVRKAESLEQELLWVDSICQSTASLTAALQSSPQAAAALPLVDVDVSLGVTIIARDFQGKTTTIPQEALFGCGGLNPGGPMR